MWHLKLKSVHLSKNLTHQLLGVQSNLPIHVSYMIKMDLSYEGALISTTAPIIVVGDSDVSNSDEQTEKWVCLDKVILSEDHC